ncbi:MAG: hypothetical protein ACR2NN_12140 [Bryobacteraceae bacterium]
MYLTCLHETGHALELPHTADFEDIMYSFQFGGNIPEYFGRYRRKLKLRGDIRRFYIFKWGRLLTCGPIGNRPRR